VKKIEASSSHSARRGEEALQESELQGITVTEAKGFGRRRTAELYRGAEYIVDFLPKVKSRSGSGMIWSRRRSTRSGAPPDRRIGDGQIFVSNIEEAIRIRTENRAGRYLSRVLSEFWPTKKQEKGCFGV